MPQACRVTFYPARHDFQLMDHQPLWNLYETAKLCTYKVHSAFLHPGLSWCIKMNECQGQHDRRAFKTFKKTQKNN